MNVGLISSGPMSKIVSKGEAKAIDEVVGKVLFEESKPIKKINQTAKMLEIKQLLKKASKINPELTFKQIRLKNWNDKSAQVEIVGYNPFKPFLNGGIFNRPTITLSATTEDLIKNQKVMDKVWPVFVAESLFFLHFLFGIDIFSRIIVAVIMALCAIAIGFAMMLYLEKKAKKFDEKITFYHWLGKFSLASMIGVIPATATLFLLQWLLPFSLENRVVWQQGIFYNVWLFTLFWSFFRINSYEASKEFLYSGGIIFILSAFIHSINSGFSFFELISFNLRNILAVDISLILFGAMLIYIAKKLPSNRSEAKLFWILNKKVKNEKNI